MKKKISTNSNVLLDVDGVILNYPDAFTNWVINRKGMEVIDDAHGTCYNLSKWFTVPPQPFATLIDEFNDTVFAANLKPYSDVVKALRDGYNNLGLTYTLVTKFGNDPILKKSRIANITKHVPIEAIDDVIFVALDETKEKALEPWRNSDILFVEDYWRNAVDANNMGLDSRIILRNYNINEVAEHRLESISNGRHLYEILQQC